MMMPHKHSHGTLNFCEKEVRMAFRCECVTLLLLLSHACIVKMKSRTDYESILETAVSQLTRNLRLVNIKQTKFDSPFGLTIYSSFGEVSVFPCVSAPISALKWPCLTPAPLSVFNAFTSTLKLDSHSLHPLHQFLCLLACTPCVHIRPAIENCWKQGTVLLPLCGWQSRLAL